MKPIPTPVLIVSEDAQAVLQARRALAIAPEVKLLRPRASLLADGLKRLSKNSVGLVLLDLNLPDSHGLDTLKSVRAAFPDIPVLVLGDLAESAAPSEALQLGAQDYVSKADLSGPVLRRAVRYAIERKQAEGALRGSAELFRSVYQEAAIGIVLTSREGRIISANPAFCRMLGYTLEEMAAKTFLDVTHPDDRRGNSRNVEDMWQGKIPQYRTDKRYITKNGDTRWAGLSTSLIRDLDGKPLYAIAMVEDITEQRHAADAIRTSERESRSLFENMLDGYARCRMIYEDGRPADFIYLEVNRAFAPLTGLKDVVGRRVSEVIPGIQQSNPELFELYGRVATTGQAERFESRIEALDVWLSISVYSPVRGEFVAVFDNITERKAG